jgi:hypothetical protein
LPDLLNPSTHRWGITPGAAKAVPERHQVPDDESSRAGRIALNTVGVGRRRAHQHRGRLSHRRASVGVHADDRPAERDWVGQCSQVLASKSAAFAGRVRARGETLPEVNEHVAGPIPGAGVERAFGTEGEAADRSA